MRRVEDITEALWGTRVSPSTVSNLNKKIYAKIEAADRRFEGEHDLYLDGIVMKWTRAGEVRNARRRWPTRSIPRDFGRFWAFAKAPRRTGRAGRRSCGTWSIVGSRACSHHLRRLPRPDGERRRVSAGRTMAALHGHFIGTFSAMCRRPGFAR